MPTKKKAAKPAPQKKTSKAVKSAPKKAVKKPSKPAPKKAVKKPAKPVKKSVPKKSTVNKSKKVAKPVKKIVKKETKPVQKKVAPAKSVKKAATKPVVKPKASVPAKKTVPTKTAPVKAASNPEVKKSVSAPVQKDIKPPVQQAIKALKKAVKEQQKVVAKPVKTTVSTSVKYQPDFTKSVLDKRSEEVAQGPLVRYSDAELQEFKDLILRKLEAAKKELVYLQGLITRKDDQGGDDGDGRYMTMEDGSVSMEREQLSQMASRQITYIDHLEKAIMRIENKTYGICRVTGKLIDKARLRAVPHATLSMEAKLGQHKQPHAGGE